MRKLHIKLTRTMRIFFPIFTWYVCEPISRSKNIEWRKIENSYGFPMNFTAPWCSAQSKHSELATSIVSQFRFRKFSVMFVDSRKTSQGHSTNWNEFIKFMNRSTRAHNLLSLKIDDDWPSSSCLRAPLIHSGINLRWVLSVSSRCRVRKMINRLDLPHHLIKV